jgi:hypothetical protein
MLAMSRGGGTIDCGSFSVSFTQALHSSSTIINGQSVYLGTTALSSSLRTLTSVYHMGDTDLDLGFLCQPADEGKLRPM